MAELAALSWITKLPATQEAIRNEARIGMRGYQPSSQAQQIYLAYLLPVGCDHNQFAADAILAALTGVVYRPNIPVSLKSTTHRIKDWPVPMVVISVYRADGD